MKLRGKKITSPNVEIIVIPRGDGNDLVFKAQAVLDASDFDKLCPRPEPPHVMAKGGTVRVNVEDPVFRKKLINYSQQRMDWLIINSLRATPELEWERVKYEDPATWSLYTEEFRESGLSDMEVTRIVNGVMTANALNESKIEEARARFLAGEQVAKEGLSSLKDELNLMPSGEPVNG